MDRQLNEIGTIPVTTSIIESLYPELKSANKKVTWLEKQGVIIRLKRGLYVINPEYSGKTLSSELIANHLYTPSYISMSTALRYYGLIPDTVYVHQSMTVKHPRSFQTPVGCYDYKHISKMAFPIGVRSMYKDNYAFLIASPEKALCDLIANHLYTPSYISMSTALRYYGLIPEAVYVHQSMTVKHPRSFQTPVGNYDYKYISRKAFPIGVRSMNKGDYAFLIASPEKALCDLIANSSKVILRYMKDVEIYLEQDIRMDMDEFYKMDVTIFEDYIKVGKKADSISTLLKFLRRWKMKYSAICSPVMI